WEVEPSTHRRTSRSADIYNRHTVDEQHVGAKNEFPHLGHIHQDASQRLRRRSKQLRRSWRAKTDNSQTAGEVGDIGYVAINSQISRIIRRDVPKRRRV